MSDTSDERVRVPFAIRTPEGTLEASVTTTAAPIPVVSVVDAARGLGDAMLGLALRRAAAEGKPSTCARGCSACCYHPVPLSAAEAHALGAAVDALPEAERAVVERRFDEVAELARSAGVTPPDVDAGPAAVAAWMRARIPCPFLSDGACTIYATRPLACREWHVSSPPALCSAPSPEVATVPVFARVARALTVVSGEVWPDAPARIPLLTALAWARARKAEATVRASGVDLLRRLLAEI